MSSIGKNSPLGPSRPNKPNISPKTKSTSGKHTFTVGNKSNRANLAIPIQSSQPVSGLSGRKVLHQVDLDSEVAAVNSLVSSFLLGVQSLAKRIRKLPSKRLLKNELFIPLKSRAKLGKWSFKPGTMTTKGAELTNMCVLGLKKKS